MKNSRLFRAVRHPSLREREQLKLEGEFEGKINTFDRNGRLHGRTYRPTHRSINLNYMTGCLKLRLECLENSESSNLANLRSLGPFCYFKTEFSRRVFNEIRN